MNVHTITLLANGAVIGGVLLWAALSMGHTRLLPPTMIFVSKSYETILIITPVDVSAHTTPCTIGIAVGR